MTHAESGNIVRASVHSWQPLSGRDIKIFVCLYWWSAVCLIKALICRTQTHVFALSCVFGPLWVFVWLLCACLVLWFSDKVIRLPVSAESQSRGAVWTSCCPICVVFDRIQPLTSFTWHTPCCPRHMCILSCEIETRPSVFTLLSDRNPLSHELAPVPMMEHWPRLRALYKATPPPTHYTTPHFTPPPPLPYYSPPSGLLREAHSSAQCWNMAECTDIWWHLCPPSTHRVYGDSPRQKERRVGWVVAVDGGWGMVGSRTMKCKVHSSSLWKWLCFMTPKTAWGYNSMWKYTCLISLNHRVGGTETSNTSTDPLTWDADLSY